MTITRRIALWKLRRWSKRDVVTVTAVIAMLHGVYPRPWESRDGFESRLTRHLKALT